MRDRPYYLLDTNVISEPTKKFPNDSIMNKLKEYAYVSAIPSISVAEIWKGIKLQEEGSKKQLRNIDYITNDVPLLYTEIPFDHHAAVIYGDVYKALRDKHLNKSENDIMIAATAIANNMILVTHNTKDFEDIPNLMVEDWFEPTSD